MLFYILLNYISTQKHPYPNKKMVILKQHLLLTFALVAFSASSLFAQVEVGLKTITEQALGSKVAFLASDLLEGREAGERGSKIASEYIASFFGGLQLKPLNSSDSTFLGRYIHPFKSTTKKGEHYNLRNVIGVLEGELSNEYVVIGAHFDHLGKRDSLIFNGADDNATGAAAVMQIAEAFVRSGIKPKRTLVFALWDGEEIGLLGSTAFVASTPIVDEIKGYINFDMIGRSSNEADPTSFAFFYSESSPQFAEWMTNAVKEYGLELKPDLRSWDKPVSGSDNAAFGKRLIPIIWYHTGSHPDYHQHTDHVELLNMPKFRDITISAYLNFYNMANQ